MRRATPIRRTILPLLLAAACGPATAQRPPPDPRLLTATEAARLLCAGRLSSETLTRTQLSAIRARPELNAFVTLDETGALEAARAADARRRPGRPCAPLDGLPIVVKDNIHVAGLPSTAGTPALKDFRPAAHAPVAQRLVDAGAVVLGKTQMHELAFGISGWNPSFATGPEPGVRNAWDTGRIAGGSSSGTGSVVGARLALAGLGTDTGGSVRVPCALNGCAALRPTVGRYPREGIAPISRTRDTAGPMAVSVADVALLDRVIAGGEPVRPALARGVRLGVPDAFWADLDDDTRAAMDAALARLRQAGMKLVPVPAADLMELGAKVGFPVALTEAREDMRAYLARWNTGVTLEALAEGIASPDVRGTYAGLVLPGRLPDPDGSTVDGAAAYEAAMREHRPALRRRYAELFARHRLDALVFPTVPRVAVPATPQASDVATFVAFIRNTDPGSDAGIPGLTLPAGLGPDSRLPVGLALDGPEGGDRRLLAVGLAVEKALGRLPPPPAR